jgi:nitrite reductase/ring-hydroxylating ferredoxin subunit
MTDSIRLNCPHCGCSMKPSAKYSDTPPYTVVECPIHGPFHFGPNTDLTLGRPPQI